MPKYIIKNEQVLSEFMDKFWKALGRKKGSQFAKMFSKDPIMQRLMRDAEIIGYKIQQRVAKDDSEFMKNYWDNLISRLTSHLIRLE